MHFAASPTTLAPALAGPAFDADGFLIDTARWDEALARELAASEGIDTLTALHWRVIGLVRDRFFALGALPVMRLVCRSAGLDPQHAHDLFHGCLSLWRIAGLPDPGEEAKAYLS